MQDVQRVDLGDARLADCTAQGFLADLVEQALALQRRQHLGIGQAANALGVVQDHGRGDDGARQRPTASLVHACHEAHRIPVQARLPGFSGG